MEPPKIIHDGILLLAVAGYLTIFMDMAPRLSPVVRLVEAPIYRMRAYGSCAFLLPSVVLAIGAMARIDRRVLPLLHNRRHFGVITAGIAVWHAKSVLDWYFAFAPISKIEALFTANTSSTGLIGFPFGLFGVFALLVLVAMAVTSHDFGLSFLTVRVWKGLNMQVYAADASVVLHVALGALMGGNPVTLLVVATSLTGLITLHLIADLREVRRDRALDRNPVQEGWIAFGDLAGFTEGRALIGAGAGAGAGAGGERIAVFRFKGRLSALSNV